MHPTTRPCPEACIGHDYITVVEQGRHVGVADLLRIFHGYRGSGIGVREGQV